MAEVNHVVVRYKDGRVLKGTTGDFYPNRPFFHLEISEGADAFNIKIDNLKAVFFVKDLIGNPLHDERPQFLHSPGEGIKGKKIAIRFTDGEVVFGYTMAYAPNRMGFFVTPSDPLSNNQRIFVVTSATQEIIVGEAADRLVQRTQAAAMR